MSLYKWSQTAADNDDADSTINLRENQAPSTFNNAVRAVMAAAAKARDDESGNLVTGGTSTAFTVTTNQVFASLQDGISVTARMHATSGAAPTFSPDGLTAKAIQSAYGVAVATGALLSGAIYKLTYDATADAWIVAGGALALPSLTPIGAVSDFAGSVAPSRWLLCYGQAVSRSTYALLFATIGTVYGVGDGSTTFNLPDCRGRVIAGKDDMGGSSANRLTDQTGGVDGDTLGDTGGAETHQLTAAQLPITTPAGTVTKPTITVANGTQVVRGAASSSPGGGNNTGSTTSTITASLDSTPAFTGTPFGGDAAHNNLPPTIIMNTIIYAGV
jgi:microcystin-dependent protein